jgi:UDPglucose--hexose-1-phosphate uridylyltransferase
MTTCDPHDHRHRRRNLLTGRWVLVSPHRAKRPWQGDVGDPAPRGGAAYDPGCYLCPGNTRTSILPPSPDASTARTDGPAVSSAKSFSPSIRASRVVCGFVGANWG